MARYYRKFADCVVIVHHISMINVCKWSTPFFFKIKQISTIHTFEICNWLPMADDSSVNICKHATSSNLMRELISQIPGYICNVHTCIIIIKYLIRHLSCVVNIPLQFLGVYVHFPELSHFIIVDCRPFCSLAFGFLQRTSTWISFNI